MDDGSYADPTPEVPDPLEALHRERVLRVEQREHEMLSHVEQREREMRSHRTEAKEELSATERDEYVGESDQRRRRLKDCKSIKSGPTAMSTAMQLLCRGEIHLSPSFWYTTAHGTFFLSFSLKCDIFW